jgi:CTP synthase
VFSQRVDVDTIYQVRSPITARALDESCRYFGLSATEPDVSGGTASSSAYASQKASLDRRGRLVHVALDAYKSLGEARTHGGIANNSKVRLTGSIPKSSRATTRASSRRRARHPRARGFGERGTEARSRPPPFARERKVPYFGICFGCRCRHRSGTHLAGIRNASSTNSALRGAGRGIDDEWMRGTKVERRNEQSERGGTMRLGAYECAAVRSQVPRSMRDWISERHRHRFEVNINYKDGWRPRHAIFRPVPDGILPGDREMPGHPGSSRACLPSRAEVQALRAASAFRSFIERPSRSRGWLDLAGS